MKELLDKFLEKWRVMLGLRLSVFIMLITILLFILTFSVCIFEVNRMTRERAIIATQDEMGDAVEIMNDYLCGVEQTVRNYSSNAHFYLDSVEGCYKLCETIVRVDSSITAATIMFKSDYYKHRPHGQHLFAPAVAHLEKTDSYERRDLVEGDDYSFDYEKVDSNWINSIKLDGGYWCEPYHDIYHTDDYVVTYSYPLHNDKGEIYGILCADVPLGWLSRRLNELRPTKHSKILLLSKYGRLIVHPEAKFSQSLTNELMLPNVATDIQQKKADILLVELYRRLMSETEGSMELQRSVTFKMADAIDTIPAGFAVYQRARSTGWMAAAFIPKEDFTEQSQPIVNRMLAWGGVGLLIMALALFFMVRKMVMPYRQFALVHAEIKSAERIQKSLITTDFPSRKTLKGKGLFAYMTPAKNIGGDLYDYYVHGDYLTFIVGDVSGKGLPATFFMAGALTLFRAFVQKGSSPARIITEINKTLMKGNDTVMFVTLFLGKLNLTTGELTFCNAGHNAPVIVHENKAEFLPVKNNFLVGVMDFDYVEEEMILLEGDKMLIYTDGVTEAADAKGNLYSDERLLEFLSDKQFDSAEHLCEVLIDDVKQHEGSTDQSDDITMMCIDF